MSNAVQAETGRKRLSSWQVRPPVLANLFLMGVGTAFLWLLDGQVFRNSLVFLGCWGASLVLWLVRLEGRSRTDWWRAVVLVVHLGPMLGTLFDLPAAYRFQKGFNSRMSTPQAASADFFSPTAKK